MKTLWTLIKSSPIYKIFAGMVIALIVFAIFNIAGTCTGKETSREEVIKAEVSDSLNTYWTNVLRHQEDSMQRGYAIKDSAWAIAYDDKKDEVLKYKNKAEKSDSKYIDLKIKYAEPCKEVIAACDQREKERLAQIQAQETVLTISDNRLNNCKANSESLNRELALADISIKSKNQTITTLKDRNTTITNRMDRNFVFRNWKWVTGNWREFVLQ